jgi:two-component system sensor histidine kinase BaeS
MMKVGIKYRLFLSMLAATAAVVLCMWLIVQWSIDRGFLRYVNTLEQERLEILATDLEQAYAERGSWDFLRAEPVTWLRLMIRTLPSGPTDPEELRRREKRLERWLEREPRPPKPGQPPRPLTFERRVLLLDAARQPLFGPGEQAGEVDLRPLRLEGETVGYLGLVPRRSAYDVHQLQFVRQQKLALALIAGVTLLVSALIALPLAKRLVRPIRALAAATRRLSAGEYASRVPVAGTDELGQLARDFNSLALTLEKNEQARRQWVADISHELRTPLAVLRGEVEALQDGVRRTTPETLHSLHAEVMRLSRMVDDLHQLALSDVGALTYRKCNVNLGEELREAADSFRSRFEGKGIVLVEDIPSAPAIDVFADPERLHQLFNNLLDNSLKYTEAGGRLDIRLETAQGFATIHFMDSAPGVPEAEIGRLFDRLYRVESSRSRATGGAGLGLAICRNIVEAHEGTITAKPSPLGGLWITVVLPITEGSL